MLRKARAGHVTGGRVFGYVNVDVIGPEGRRSYVERRINDDEAAVVPRIFRMCADGAGLTRITKILNDGRRCGYAFEGMIALDRLLSGVVELPTKMASPNGLAPYSILTCAS